MNVHIYAYMYLYMCISIYLYLDIYVYKYKGVGFAGPPMEGRVEAHDRKHRRPETIGPQRWKSTTSPPALREGPTRLLQVLICAGTRRHPVNCGTNYGNKKDD